MRFTKETLRRAVRTFLQAFIPALIVGLESIDFNEDKTVLKGALIALIIPSIAAGISAVMNLETIFPKEEEDYFDE